MSESIARSGMLLYFYIAAPSVIVGLHIADFHPFLAGAGAAIGWMCVSGAYHVGKADGINRMCRRFKGILDQRASRWRGE